MHWITGGSDCPVSSPNGPPGQGIAIRVRLSKLVVTALLGACFRTTWKRPEPSNILETQMLLGAVRHITRNSANWDKKIVIAVDNLCTLAVVGSARDGKSTWLNMYANWLRSVWSAAPPLPLPASFPSWKNAPSSPPPSTILRSSV